MNPVLNKHRLWQAHSQVILYPVRQIQVCGDVLWRRQGHYHVLRCYAQRGRRIRRGREFRGNGCPIAEQNLFQIHILVKGNLLHI